MDSYQRLIDALPARSPPGRSHRVSEKATRAAVARLPLANPVQAAREVEQILDGMLATSWPGGERIVALEHLRVPVAVLCAGIARQVGVESHPLAQTIAEQAATAQRMHEKLASGYAIGLHEFCEPAGRLPRFKSKLAASAAVLGLVHANHALLWACRRYLAPPAELWRRAHALYAFAGEIGIVDQMVGDAAAEGVACNTRDAYAHLLLFAIGNPYRFSARELDEAWQVCGCVASLCVLARAGSVGIGVDTDADTGPGYIPEERLTTRSWVLSIDIEPAQRALDERVAMLPQGINVLDLPRPGGGRIPTSTHFLGRLCTGWGNAPRGHARLEATHALDIVVGMHALHYALAGNIDFASFVRRVHSDAITVGQHDLSSAAWAEMSDAAHPRVFRGEVLDQSAGGYRMRLTVAEGLRLRIGEVVGLAPVVDGMDARDWMVGVIRWLRHEDESVLLGIELLRREARAAGVRAMTAAGETMTPQRAVELLNGGHELLSLLVTHPFAGNVVAAEVVLPRLASDWRSQAAVGQWRPGEVETLGPACFRVTLVRDDHNES